MDEPATGIIDGITKFVISAGYSLVNSPKIVLTGRSWSGSSQTSTERIESLIDAVSSYVPVSKMTKVSNPGSWYKFKKANKHIPVSKKKSIYEAEVRKYREKIKGNRTFEKVKRVVDESTYIYNQIDEEEE